MTESVLVVGASGPLGRAVVVELRNAGHSIAAVSRSGQAGTDRLDVTDRRPTSAALQRMRPDVIVYLARPVIGSDSRARDITSAIDSLRGFALDAIESGARRLVFASSAAVYGADSPRPSREDDPIDVASAYAELKLRSELALDEVASGGLASATSLRIFNVYGPGFGNSLVNRLVLGGDPVVYESEAYVRDYIHVSDVARAFAFAVEEEGAGSAVLNLGTGAGTSNPALLALCRGAAYRPHPDSAISSSSVADTTRIRERWGFLPRVSLADAVGDPARFS